MKKRVVLEVDELVHFDFRELLKEDEVTMKSYLENIIISYISEKKGKEYTKKYKRSIKEQRDERIIYLSSLGLSHTSIAKDVGCHRRTISRILKSHGFEDKRTIIKKEIKNCIQKRLTKKETYKKLVESGLYSSNTNMVDTKFSSLFNEVCHG